MSYYMGARMQNAREKKSRVLRDPGTPKELEAGVVGYREYEEY